MSSKVEGRCVCNAVTYSGDVKEPREFGVCHCSMCRRWGGGPGFAFDMTNVVIVGEEALTWFKSSDWAERGFCSKCGTHLFYRLTGDTPHYIPFLGSLDEADSFKLSEHIFIDAKPDTYEFADAAPRLAEADVLARFSGDAE